MSTINARCSVLDRDVFRNAWLGIRANPKRMELDALTTQRASNRTTRNALLVVGTFMLWLAPSYVIVAGVGQLVASFVLGVACFRDTPRIVELELEAALGVIDGQNGLGPVTVSRTVPSYVSAEMLELLRHEMKIVGRSFR